MNLFLLFSSSISFFRSVSSVCWMFI